MEKNSKTTGRAGRLATCAAAAVLASSMALPTAALADGASADGQSYDVTYSFMESEGGPQAAPAEIDADGHHWKLKGMSSLQADGNYIHAKKSATATETKTATPAELAAVEASFPSTRTVTVEGVTGEIPLTGITRTAVYDDVSRQVDYQQDYPGLPSNDVAQLATTRDYPEGTLRLSDVSWSVDAVDEHGVPTSYTAHCNYRGQVTSRQVALYELTASYAGEIEDPENRMVTTATYVLDDPVAEPAPEDPYPWFAAVAAGAAAAAAALLGGFGFWRFRNNRARVVEVRGDAEKLLARVKIAKKGARFQVDIPTDVPLQLNDQVKTWLEFPEAYVKKGGHVTAYQFASDGSRTVVYDGEIMKHVAVVNTLVHL